MTLETIHTIISLTVFVIGTLFGSFFTLAIYRIPRKQDITHTRSYCPRCKHKLGFFDCFPILSYVSTIGRCRYCKCFISIRYPLIELASGLFFLLSYLFLGFSINFVIFIAGFVYLVLVIGSDIMEKKMTPEERLEVEKIVKEKKEKKEAKKKSLKKAGAINVEIVIAMVVFVMYFATTMYITSNYRNGLENTKVESNALNILVNNMEVLKEKAYDELASENTTTRIDGKEYRCDIHVSYYLKDGYSQVDNAKEINVTVEYLIDGKTESISASLIREAVL